MGRGFVVAGQDHGPPTGRMDTHDGWKRRTRRAAAPGRSGARGRRTGRGGPPAVRRLAAGHLVRGRTHRGRPLGPSRSGRRTQRTVAPARGRPGGHRRGRRVPHQRRPKRGRGRAPSMDPRAAHRPVGPRRRPRCASRAARVRHAVDGRRRADRGDHRGVRRLARHAGPCHGAAGGGRSGRGTGERRATGNRLGVVVRPDADFGKTARHVGRGSGAQPEHSGRAAHRPSGLLPFSSVVPLPEAIVEAAMAHPEPKLRHLLAEVQPNITPGSGPA